MLRYTVGFMREKIIFTDLDGSLLDEETYQASPADSLLEMLDNLGVPLVFNSSKTFPEMLKIRRLLGNHQPFVVENGSAVYVPFDHDIAAGMCWVRQGNVCENFFGRRPRGSTMWR